MNDQDNFSESKEVRDNFAIVLFFVLSFLFFYNLYDIYKVTPDIECKKNDNSQSNMYACYKRLAEKRRWMEIRRQQRRERRSHNTGVDQDFATNHSVSDISDYRLIHNHR